MQNERLKNKSGYDRAQKSIVGAVHITCSFGLFDKPRTQATLKRPRCYRGRLACYSAVCL